MRIQILDSTLNDGVQSGRVFFTVEDKLSIAHRLDEFGIDYIDGGRPTDPLDREFFERARNVRFKHARLAASGGLGDVEHLLEAVTPAVCLSGESWDLRVFKTQSLTADQHFASISTAVRRLKDAGREVIYNAEHFFDAWEANPNFALSTIQAADAAGADAICLCDSNGGTLSSRLAEICAGVRHCFKGTLGIHAHNDADLAVANALTAVENGFNHVQGCINGYGDRCGCANLCSILPNLELKAGHQTVGREHLEGLNGLAHYIAGLANAVMPPEQPYVGSEAFVPGTEHIRPQFVGNKPAQTVSAQDIAFFTLLSYEVSVRKTQCFDLHSTADVSVEVNDAVLSASAAGQGPVHALDLALRQCLLPVYPSLGRVRLVDYKVRILNPEKGFAAKANVLAEFTDEVETWTTTGVSDNLIEASWLALSSAVQLELSRWHKSHATALTVPDYSWAV